MKRPRIVNGTAKLILKSDDVKRPVQVYTGNKKLLTGENFKYVELWAY